MSKGRQGPLENTPQAGHGMAVLWQRHGETVVGHGFVSFDQVYGHE